jgi:flagellar biogenesis protein FliO
VTLTAILLAAPDAGAQLASMNSQIVQYVEVLLGLIGVLILAYLTLRVGLPWFFQTRNPGDGPIEVLAHYSLEPKKGLYLVKTGSQVFLIGTGENQVAYLTAVSEENAAEIVRSVRQREVPRRDFRQILSRFQKPGKAE